MNEYYTYVLIDPRTSQPFYVGKGTKRRMYDHWKHRRAKRVKNWRLKRVLCELDAQKLKPLYNKILDNVTHGQAIQKEIELIREYGRLDTGTGILCNLTCGGDGVAGWSQEQRNARRIHELKKGKGRPVSQYTLDGAYVKTYTSAKVASEHVLSANRSYITQCCKRKRLSAGGFMWIYANDPAPAYRHKRCPPIDQYSKDGTLIATHVSSAEAAKSVGTSARLISACCAGKTKTCKGFVWKYTTGATA